MFFLPLSSGIPLMHILFILKTSFWSLRPSLVHSFFFFFSFLDCIISNVLCSRLLILLLPAYICWNPPLNFSFYIFSFHLQNFCLVPLYNFCPILSVHELLSCFLFSFWYDLSIFKTADLKLPTMSNVGLPRGWFLLIHFDSLNGPSFLTSLYVLWLVVAVVEKWSFDYYW